MHFVFKKFRKQVLAQKELASIALHMTRLPESQLAQLHSSVDDWRRTFEPECHREFAMSPSEFAMSPSERGTILLARLF
jgi:hypothetical protein